MTVVTSGGPDKVVSTMGPWIILALSAACLSAVRGETTVEMMPSNRRGPGESVDIICKVTGQFSTNTVLWWRKMGEIREQIGTGVSLDSAFKTDNRYQISSWGQDTGTAYKLTVSGLRYEDSAELGCSLRQSGEDPVYMALAVCPDVENQACLCMAKTGFNSPECYNKDPSIAAWEKRYTTATTGLGVCLAIAIIFGLVMAIIVGWDCTARLAAKRKKKQEAAKLRAGHDPRMYEASEELVMDPNDSMSQGSNVNFAGEAKKEWKPRNDKGRSYNQVVTQAVAHTNEAYKQDDDLDYQKLKDSPDMPPKYNNVQAQSRPTHNNAYDARPSPRGPPSASNLQNRYGPDPYPAAGNGPYAGGHSPMGAGPPSPGDGLYGPGPGGYGGALGGGYDKSPAAWSTQSASAGPPPGAFRYPETAYNNGDVSPRMHAQPNPRNAYSERPPAKGGAGYGRDQHRLEPKQLYFRDGQSGPQYDEDENDYEQYGSNPSGPYIDTTGRVV